MITALMLVAFLPASRDVRDVVALIRRKCVALSFIEAAQPTIVLVDESAPPDKLVAEVLRQTSRYEVETIEGRRVLMAREPRYHLRLDGVKISGSRFAAAGDLISLLAKRRSEFTTFSGWAIFGSWLGGRPDHVPLIDDVVTDDRPGEVVEHLVRLLGTDERTYFNVGYFMRGNVKPERASGLAYGRLDCEAKK